MNLTKNGGRVADESLFKQTSVGVPWTKGLFWWGKSNEWWCPKYAHILRAHSATHLPLGSSICHFKLDKYHMRNYFIVHLSDFSLGILFIC